MLINAKAMGSDELENVSGGMGEPKAVVTGTVKRTALRSGAAGKPAAGTVGASGASGTAGTSSGVQEQLMRMECPYCHEIFQANVMKSSVECPTCHKIITIKG